MKKYILTESEEKFANIIWSNEPIASGDLVKLCEKGNELEEIYHIYCAEEIM